MIRFMWSLCLLLICLPVWSWMTRHNFRSSSQPKPKVQYFEDSDMHTAHAMMNQGKYFQRILMHNVIPRWKLAHFEIRFCYKTLCLPTSPHFQWHFLKVCNLNKVNRNYLDIFRKHMESSLSDAFLTGMVGMRWFWFSLQQHLFVWSLTRFCLAWEIKNPGDERIILTI